MTNLQEIWKDLERELQAEVTSISWGSNPNNAGEILRWVQENTPKED